MKKMQEPPLGSVLLDAYACAWQRTPAGWAICGSDNSWHYTWKQLLEDLYPKKNLVFMTAEEWEPVMAESGELPRILFVPGEELIEVIDE